MRHSFHSLNVCRLIVVASLLAHGIVSGVHAQTPTLLRWKFKVADKWSTSVTQEITVTQRIKDADVRTAISQQFDLNMTVLEVSPQGTATIAQQIDRIRGKLTLNGMDAGSYDSAVNQPAAGAWASIAPLFKAIVGMDLSLMMNPRGEILMFTVPPEMASAVAKLPKLGQLKEFVSAESLQNLIGSSLLVLPEAAVPPGHVWSVTRYARNPLTGPQMITAALSFEGPQKQGVSTLQKISIDLDVLPDQAAGINPQAQAAQIKQQEGKGFALFDNVTGRLVESELRQTMAMSVSLRESTVDQQVEILVRSVVKPTSGPLNAKK